MRSAGVATLAMSLLLAATACLGERDRVYIDDRDGGDTFDGPIGDGHSVGGQVTGLVGSGLVLASSGETLSISTNGPFTFGTKVASGAEYKVSVKTQPSAPSQACAIAGGSGTVGKEDISSVVVNCASDAFTIGGVAAGLVGKAVLTLNGTDVVTVSANGSFAFPTPLKTGATYAVAVTTQPSDPSQTCTLANGSGTVASAPINDLVLTCSTNAFAVGGVVSGLVGTGLVLLDNGVDPTNVSANGAFQFSSAISSGGTYAITVGTQPSAPQQTCLVTSGTGKVTTTNVTDVAVVCSTDKYKIGGVVSGLFAPNLTLRLTSDATEDLVVSKNGAFEFPTAVENGKPYAVTIFSDANGETCDVTNGAGNVGTAKVTNVTVRCRVLQAFDTTPLSTLPAGWTSSAVHGSAAPFTVVNSMSDSPSQSVFVPGNATLADVELVTPSIPITRVDEHVTFRHRFAFTDETFDGGVLEISIDGGPFVDLVTAGGSFPQGGYVKTMASGSIIAGRQAWTGNPGSFTTSEAVLPASAFGKAVRLRWLAASDSAFPSTGWWIDSLAIDP